MLTTNDKSITPGNPYTGPVYRDPIRLIQAESTNTTAFAMGDPIPEATFNSRIAAFDKFDLVTSAGTVPMGAGDSLLISLLGTNAANETVLLTVLKWVPQVHFTGGQWAVVSYAPELVGIFTWTLGTLVASQADASNPSGIDATDLYADTVVQTIPDPTLAVPANMPSPGVVLFSPADNSKAYIIVPADGAHALQVITDRGTADTGLVVGRRLRGDAMRSV